MRKMYILSIVAIICLTSSMICLFVGAITEKLLFFQGAVALLVFMCFIGAVLLISQILQDMHDDEEDR